MCRLWQPLCLLFVAAVCRGQVESGAGQGDEALTQLLQALRQLRRAQEAVETDAVNMSEMVKEKFDSLDQRLDAVMNNAQEYFGGATNLFAHWMTAVCPKKNKKKTSTVPLCPFTSCFQELLMKESSVKSLRTFANLRDVTSRDGCALLCRQNLECHALFYDEIQKSCKLVTNRHLHIEPSGPTVKVWAKSSSNLGKCSISFRYRWETSRYRFVRRRRTWNQAKYYCSIWSRGKLAELTSSSEIEWISKLHSAGSMKFWHVGGRQISGYGEPAGGWRWSRSNISIPSDGFRWKPNQPDNYKGENYMNAEKINGTIYFNDLDSKYKPDGYLCECIEFPRCNPSVPACQ